MFSAFKKFGKLGALASSVARAWSPLALWPDGIDTPGMWISPRDLTSQWQDYTGTTPVAAPGTVADTSNPVGLALDIRAGAPGVLGPELVVNGDFATDTDWDKGAGWSISGGKLRATSAPLWISTSQSLTPFTVGSLYEVSFEAEVTSGAFQVYLGNTTHSWIPVAASGSYKQVIAGNSNAVYVQSTAAGASGSFDNISVKEVPGNHMLQSTSAARPLLSARVNLARYTEDFGAAAWGNPTWGSGTSAYTRNYAAAPDGTLTATRLVATAPTTSPVSGGSTGTDFTSGLHTRTVWLKSNTGSDQLISLHIDAQVGSLRTVTPTWAPYQITFSDASYGLDLGVYRSGGAADTDASCDILMWHPQIELGTTATPYQSIPGNGSTYASTGITPFQLYDGVDDGMATAAFSAGTLINGMDCMIAVRRDSGAKVVFASDGSDEYFGYCDTGSGAGNTYAAGSPTVWVDNIQLAGGTAVTAGTIHSALTVGDWHILEFRGLDLSAWASFCFSKYYSGFYFPGARGDIMLFESTASTEDKDAARQYLADKYGVTLA